jgi:hypothetical protein
MDAQQRLSTAGANAKQAEARGEDVVAAREWRRYRLIKDATRDPEDLLHEGLVLSAQAIELAATSR